MYVSVHVTKTARLLSSVHAICPVSIFKFTHDARNLRCLQKSGFMVCITPFDTNKHTHLYVQSFTYISSGLPQSFSESDSRKLSALSTETLMFRKVSIVVCSQIVASRAYGPGLWTVDWTLDSVMALTVLISRIRSHMDILQKDRISPEL